MPQLLTPGPDFRNMPVYKGGHCLSLESDLQKNIPLYLVAHPMDRRLVHFSHKWFNPTYSTKKNRDRTYLGFVGSSPPSTTIKKHVDQ